MRPKWLLFLVPVLIGLAALLLSGTATPSSATVARVFSAGQWKVSASPRGLRCALIEHLDQRGGTIGRAVVALIEHFAETSMQWSGLSLSRTSCPDAKKSAVPIQEPKGPGQMANAIDEITQTGSPRWGDE